MKQQDDWQIKEIQLRTAYLREHDLCIKAEQQALRELEQRHQQELATLYANSPGYELAQIKLIINQAQEIKVLRDSFLPLQQDIFRRQKQAILQLQQQIEREKVRWN